MNEMLIITILFYAPALIIIGMGLAWVVIIILEMVQGYHNPSKDISELGSYTKDPEKLVFYARYGGEDHYVTEAELKRLNELYPTKGNTNG